MVRLLAQVYTAAKRCGDSYAYTGLGIHTLNSGTPVPLVGITYSVRVC